VFAGRFRHRRRYRLEGGLRRRIHGYDGTCRCRDGLCNR
jgi:hypothetical protein